MQSADRFSGWRLTPFVLLTVLSVTPLGCPEADPPPAAAPGLPQHQELAFVPVPGGAVNAAGGNLLVTRTDLSIDTRLGTQRIGAVYNSASGTWLWSFDISRDAGSFVDGTGAVHDTSGLGPGDAVPGTVWVLVDADTVKTKGGLAHDFDANGRLQAVHWTSSAYPRLEMVSQTIAGQPRTRRIRQCTAPGACGDVFVIGRDAMGRVVSVTDRARRRAELAYDASGSLVVARDGLDTARGWAGFRYEYEGTRLTAITSSEGERIEIDYAAASPRVRRVRPIGTENPVYHFKHQGRTAGLYTTTYTNPLGHRTTYRYDAERRIHEVRNLETGETTQLVYAGGAVRPAWVVDPAGVVTAFTYANDDLATAMLPSGNLVTHAYAPGAVDRDEPTARPILSITDSLGLVAARAYDPAGRLVAVTNGASETTTLEYDLQTEMLKKRTTSIGVGTEFSGHGDHGHPTTLSIGGNTTQHEYDAVGNHVRGPSLAGEAGGLLGGVIARHYDEDRNLNSVELADHASTFFGTAGYTLSIEHRSDGRRTLIARPSGGDAVFVYDALGRMVERQDRASGAGFASWQATRFEYDVLGRRTALERPNGMRQEWIYDAAGRVREHRVLEDGVLDSASTRTYGDGRLVSLFDSVHARPETYAYDAAGRIRSVTFPEGESISRAFDLRSRPTLSVLWMPTGLLRSLEHGYDGADRETRLEDQGRTVLERSFSGGRIDSVTYGNGLTRTFQYDPADGHLMGSETRQGAALVESTRVERDFQGSLYDVSVTATTQTYGALPRQTTELHLLEGSQVLGGNPGDRQGPRVTFFQADGAASEYYYHDELSNRQGADPEAPSFVYNPEKNRLLEIDETTPGIEMNHSYAYDEAGFAIGRDGVALDWDGAGRIRGIGSAASFVWDTGGRMVSRTLAGTVQRRRFGDLVEADAAGAPTALDLGEVRIDLATDERLYRHPDFRGNVKFTTDDAGAVVAHYQYSAYGVWAVHGDPGSPEANRSFAQGREYAGLRLLGHRLYDADATRFLAPDPVYQLINHFSYTLGNPVWFWDFLGLQGTLIGLTAGEWAGATAAATGIYGGAAFLAGGPPGTAGVVAFGGTVSALFKVLDLLGGFPWNGDAIAGAAQAAGETGSPGVATGGDPSTAPLPDVSGNGAAFDRYNCTACGGGRDEGAGGAAAMLGASGAGAVGGGCYAPVGAATLPNLGGALVLLGPSVAFLCWRIRREACRSCSSGGQSSAAPRVCRESQ